MTLHRVSLSFTSLTKMTKSIFIAVVLAFTLSVKDTDAAECCGAYTDIAGTYHKPVLCTDYCCLLLDVAYKGCCSNPLQQISATKNQNAACVRSWIKENIWAPIVAGIVGLIILIGTCTCCCCGCCACCRKNPSPVIINTVPRATSLAMTTTTTTHTGRVF